jgi:hypothetical protein
MNSELLFEGDDGGKIVTSTAHRRRRIWARRDEGRW